MIYQNILYFAIIHFHLQLKKDLIFNVTSFVSFININFINFKKIKSNPYLIIKIFKL